MPERRAVVRTISACCLVFRFAPDDHIIELPGLRASASLDALVGGYRVRGVAFLGRVGRSDQESPLGLAARRSKQVARTKLHNFTGTAIRIELHDAGCCGAGGFVSESDFAF